MLLILRISVGRAWNVVARRRRRNKSRHHHRFSMPINVLCALNFTEESLKIKDMRSMNATCIYNFNIKDKPQWIMPRCTFRWWLAENTVLALFFDPWTWMITKNLYRLLWCMQYVWNAAILWKFYFQNVPRLRLQLILITSMADSWTIRILITTMVKFMV